MKMIHNYHIVHDSLDKCEYNNFFFIFVSSIILTPPKIICSFGIAFDFPIKKNCLPELFIRRNSNSQSTMYIHI